MRFSIQPADTSSKIINTLELYCGEASHWWMLVLSANGTIHRRHNFCCAGRGGFKEDNTMIALREDD